MKEFSLDISKSYNLTQNFSFLCESIKNSTNLKKLSLDDCKLDDHDLQLFIGNVIHNKSIISLDISW